MIRYDRIQTPVAEFKSHSSDHEPTMVKSPMAKSPCSLFLGTSLLKVIPLLPKNGSNRIKFFFNKVFIMKQRILNHSPYEDIQPPRTDKQSSSVDILPQCACPTHFWRSSASCRTCWDKAVALSNTLPNEAGNGKYKQCHFLKESLNLLRLNLLGKIDGTWWD